ncbi:MAG: hypothetical protein HYZ83_04745 [Candidatus Omnitrophica bacterium]|nr:hypothetical protein [Candidatus Omnitrophota bacterium]
MTEKSAATYVCPMCNRTMERDIILFLNHTDEHVIDRIKQANPKWVAEDGICEPCVQYYRSQIAVGSDSNIGPDQRRKRVRMGIICLVLSVLAEIYFVSQGFPRSLRLILFAPLYLGMFGLIQAREKTCAVLAEMGEANMDSGTKKIQDKDIICALKKKGRKIFLHSLLWAAILTFLFLIP